MLNHVNFDFVATIQKNTYNAMEIMSQGNLKTSKPKLNVRKIENRLHKQQTP